MGFLRRLPILGIVLLAVGLGLLAAWYMSFIGQQRRYLMARNFRVLTTLAMQVEGTISGQQGKFRSVVFSSQRSLQPLSREPRPQPPNRLLLCIDPPGRIPDPMPEKKPDDVEATSQFEPSPRGVLLKLSFSLRLPTRSTNPGASEPTPLAEIRLGAKCLFRSVFEAKLRQDVFETLALATADGQVLLAAGRHEQELLRSRLDALARPARGFPSWTAGRTRQASDDGKTPAAPSFGTLARTMSVDQVIISGVEYKLFMHPCCDATGAAGSPGFLVAGLVEADRFTSNTLAIPPGIVIACVAAVSLAATGWPFLKLILLGAHQRFKKRDVLLVGACGIFGLSLVTVILLDVYAYRRFSATGDPQLEALAQEIDRQLKGEIGNAYEQLESFERQALDKLPEAPALRKRRIFGQAECKEACPDYPSFITFALIDDGGFQHVKWGPESWVPPAISVKTRPYFSEVREGRAWKRVCDDQEGCFIESIWSRTTGAQEAALSKPTPGEGFPVSALSIPMRSLIGPVVAAGFEFAVIDDDGRVLFHSDQQRNTFESFFAETDMDRRLRAAVRAHSSEVMNLRYWGRRYRAHVERMAVPAWSVVTLSDKRPAWGVHVDWLMVTLLFLAVYMLTCATALAFGFSRRRAWFWPDPRRRSRYLQLSFAYVILAAVFGVALATLDGLSLLLVTCAIPVLAWVLTDLALRRPPPASSRRAERSARRPRAETRSPYPAYTTAAVLLLLLTSAVPATGFLVTARAIFVRTYVKHGQLTLARSLQERWNALESDQHKTKDIDFYYGFFFDTRCELLQTDELRPDDFHDQSLLDTGCAFRPADVPNNTGRPGQGRDLLEEFLEDHAPYYSEASVGTTELLHNRADDEAWRWDPEPQRRLTLRYGKPERIGVSSSIPLLVGSGSEDRNAPGWPWLALIAAALLGVAWALVWFVRRYLFLAGVSEPVWSSGRLATESGDNLFILCDARDRERLATDAYQLKLGPILASHDEQAWIRELMLIDRFTPGRPVLIADFDVDLDDPALTEKKLGRIEDLIFDRSRTLLVVSGATPDALHQTLHAAAARPTGADPRLADRWRAVLDAFVVIDWRPAPEVADETAEGVDDSVAAALDAEGSGDPFVSAICGGLRHSLRAGSVQLTSDQVLDEIADRCSNHYVRLWRSCVAEEKLVLASIASHGFANSKDRRAVRRLLSRRLIRKDPNLRVMNETFRRFILSPACDVEVSELEGTREPSPWDQLRIPFSVGLAAAAGFFVLTQRELFDATVAGVTTLTVSLPALFRAIGLVAGGRTAGGDSAAGSASRS